MGLAREVPVAGLTERGARAGRRLGQELIEARPRHQEQAVRGPGAGDGEPTECGVELVELGGAGQRVERDGDAVRLALPAVDRGGDEVVLGEPVLLLQPLDRLRGVVDRLIAGRQNCHQGIVRFVARLDDGDFAGRRAGVVVLGLLQCEAAGEELIEEVLHELRQRQVDVGRLGFLEPVDLQQHRKALGDLLPDLCGQAS